MRTLTKTFLGAAMVAGIALATSEPASAQPGYGDGVYGRSYNDGRYGPGGRGYEYDDRYGERYYRGGGLWRSTRNCTSPRFGRWRFDPYMQRRVFIPYRWAVRAGYLRNCMYTMNRYGVAGAYR